MKHYHVILKGDRDRTVGALATTLESAKAEASIEKQGSREASVVECDKECFSATLPSPPTDPPKKK